MQIKDALEIIISALSLLVSLYVLRRQHEQSIELAFHKLELDSKLEEHKRELDNKQEREMAQFRRQQQKEIKLYEAQVQSMFAIQLEQLRSKLSGEAFAGGKLYEKRLEYLPELLRTLRITVPLVKALISYLDRGWPISAGLYQEIYKSLVEFNDVYKKSSGFFSFDLTEKIRQIYDNITMQMPAGMDDEDPKYKYTFDKDVAQAIRELAGRGLAIIQEVEGHFSYLLQIEKKS